MQIRSAFLNPFAPDGLATCQRLESVEQVAAFLSGSLAVVASGPSVRIAAFWASVRRGALPMIPGMNAAVEGLVIWTPPASDRASSAVLYSLDRLIAEQMESEDHVVQSEKLRREMARTEVLRKLNQFRDRPDAPFYC